MISEKIILWRHHFRTLLFLSQTKVTNKKLKKYEKEFIIHKEQEAQMEDPVVRLRVMH